ncbi:leucine rich repeat containing protein 6 [Echinococcus multilocularis]|uniref:Leucine rich repeat containing protein 6 n=1 Tax=Echinococcus multilocularis TaxID=6211 RepID=A0A068XYU6_ECHMU|nr:leucine rich repeat containing protein 6 [Echinococcus multilocularis]
MTVTEELVRKRAEHNEGEICSLEELALHQQDIEKTILLPELELEYLNLALNNIEIIENLEETGTHGEFYWESVHRLCWILDGEEIGKAERITAFQNLPKHYKSILNSQEEYFHKRAHEKVQAQQRKERFSKKLEENNGDIGKIAEEFWQEKGPYTPESRSETYEFLRLQKEQEYKKTTSFEKTKPRRKVFFAEDGRPYNINEPKVEFKFYEEIKGDEQYFVLDVAAYKNMDTTLIDCDVQTNYVRVTLRNKVFQMALPEEVHPDKSSVQRSRVTGRLLVRMPKVRASSMIKPRIAQANHTTGCTEKTESKEKAKERKSSFLTVGETKASVDWRNITNTGDSHLCNLEMAKRAPVSRRKERKNSPSFVDNPDVPPLE